MGYAVELLKLEKTRLIKRFSEAKVIDYKEAIKELDEMQNNVDFAIKILTLVGEMGENNCNLDFVSNHVCQYCKSNKTTVLEIYCNDCDSYTKTV